MQTKALLLAVKARLTSALAAYVRPSDVFITPDPDFLPHGYRMPCVGIKDGPVRIAEGHSNTEEHAYQVALVVWAAVNKPEATIVGDAASGAKGLLEVAADVVKALRGETLDLPGFQWARPVEVGETELAADENSAASRQAIVFEFTWEGEP